MNPLNPPKPGPASPFNSTAQAQLRLHLTVQRLLIHAEDAAAAATEALRILAVELDAAYGECWQIDPATSAFQRTASSGSAIAESAGSSPRPLAAEFDKSILSRAVNSRATVVITSAGAPGGHLSRVECQLHTIAVPGIREGQVTTVLLFTSGVEPALDEVQRESLELLAAQIGAALERRAAGAFAGAPSPEIPVQHQAVSTEQRRAEEVLRVRSRLTAQRTELLSALARTPSPDLAAKAATELLLEHLDVQAAHIWMENRAGDHLELLGATSPVNVSPPSTQDVGQILRAGRPVLDSSGQIAGWTSFAAYPFTTESGIQGLVSVAAQRLLDPPTLATLGMYASVVADYIQRREVERSRRESNALLRAVVEGTSDAIFFKDHLGCYLMINTAGAELLGRSVDEVVGRYVRDLFPPEEARIIMAWDHRVISTGEPVSYEHTSSLAGESRTYLTTKTPYRDAEGNVIGLVGISRDTTEQKKAEALLRQAKEAAESATQARSDFLAKMSHEIRTPMNGVIGMAELALDAGSASEQREYLGHIKRSGEALLTVINNILEFSRIDGGKLGLDRIPFNVRRLLQSNLGMLSVRARQKGLEVRWQVPDAVPEILIGDPGRLSQILLNLAGNSIKFTDRGEISVSVESVSRSGSEITLHFSVRDTGIGIRQEKQREIFEAFVQADNSITRRYGGTGLGLAISSELVELMGGRIWVESIVGEGSTFHFTARFEWSDDTTATHEILTSLDMGGQVVPPLRVLVAEDDETNRIHLERLLQRDGHSVKLVSTGGEAIRSLQSEPFDLVLMDVQMPEMSGLEAVGRIRDSERRSGGHVPIVALTALAMAGDRERCLGAGMDGHLSKPLRAQELRDTIRNVLAQSPPSSSGLSEPGASGERVIDLEEFDAMVAGDPELRRELIGHFLTCGPEYLFALKSACSTCETAGIARYAHLLKGSLRVLCAGSASSIADEVEALARREKPAEAAAAAARLEAELNRLLAYLPSLLG